MGRSRSWLFFSLLLVIGFLPLKVRAQEGRDPADKVEIEFHSGGTLSDIFGQINGRCFPAVPDGCTPSFNLSGDVTGRFMTAPGLMLRSGALYGARIGIDTSPRWQFEFLYQYSPANLQFPEPARQQALDEAVSSTFPGFSTLYIYDEGERRGHVEIYQFNSNYHLRASGRVVPYIGGGSGWVRFRNGPNLDFEYVDIWGNQLRSTVRSARDVTSFAFNLAAGVKVYMTRHVGLRFEARDIFARYQTTHSFETVDVNGTWFPPFVPGTQGPNTGNFTQSNTFNLFTLTVGFLFRF